MLSDQGSNAVGQTAKPTTTSSLSDTAAAIAISASTDRTATKTKTAVEEIKTPPTITRKNYFARGIELMLDEKL